MALFGKKYPLASVLKRLQAGGTFAHGELETLFDALREDPEFKLEKNTWLFFHTNADIRAFAAKQLRAWGQPGLVDQLIRELPGKSPGAIQEVSRLVGEVGASRIFAHLGRMIHAPAREDREAALELMSVVDSFTDLLPYLKVAIRDTSPSVRFRAARIMVRGLDNPSIFLILRDLINDPSEKLRFIIIEAFARKPTPEIVEPFFERLLEDDPKERSLLLPALMQLARTRQDQVADRVLPMLGNEKGEIREIAAKLLSEMPDRVRVLRAFLVHCRGLAFWLRERSIDSLKKVSDSLVEPLMKLMKDEEEDIRVGAMMLAGGSRDPRLAELIQEIFLGKSEWWIRVSAAEILNQFPGEEITRVILSRLQDPDLYYAIISLLGKRDGAESLKALFQCLESPRRGVRSTAVGVLAQRKSPEVLSRIARMAEEDPDEGVREKAEDALRNMGDEGQILAEKISRKRREAEEAVCVASDLQMENDELNQRKRARSASPAAGAGTP
jgi:HEAT repeat protein